MTEMTSKDALHKNISKASLPDMGVVDPHSIRDVPKHCWPVQGFQALQIRGLWWRRKRPSVVTGARRS